VKAVEENELYSQLKEQPTVSLLFSENEHEHNMESPFVAMGTDNLDSPTVLT
jgi:hypothetical protein